MVERFEDDEERYLSWLKAHPLGYVVNVDKAGYMPQYPMIHAASHKAVSSPKIGNFTTGSYFKVCSEGMEELEHWAQQNYGRRLSRCAKCM